MSSGARVCPHCGVARPARGNSFALPLLFFLSILVAIGVSSNEHSTQEQAPSSTAPAAGPLAHTPEGEFFGAAISYLETANQLALGIARTEAGLNDGTTTLKNVRDSAETASHVELAAYSGDYRARLRGRIPAAYKHDAEEIDRLHRLLSSAIDQTASAAGEPSADGAESATRTLRRAVLVMQAEMHSIKRKLDAYAAAHPGDTVAQQ